MYPQITDPRWAPRDYNALEAFAIRMLRDERDLVFVRTAAFMSVAVLPFAAAFLLVPGLFRWWMFPFYLAVLMPVFMDRYILMLHATSHRPVFKRRFAWLEGWIPWVLGPLFGQTPTSFFVHHVGMHHAENNLLGDLSTTLPYRRDSFRDFLHYWARFNLTGTVHLALYFYRRGRMKLFRRFLGGEVAYLAALAFFLWWNPAAALAVLVFPLVFARFALMAGNWSQHAFVDMDDPGNPYKNSITLINCRHNRRCYNDGYHVVHHVKQNLHWSEHPAHFEAHIDEYVEHGAIVFEDVFSYQKIFVLLMTGRYDKLAERFVHLGGEKRSQEEIVALLQERVQTQRGERPRFFALDAYPAPDPIALAPIAAK